MLKANPTTPLIMLTIDQIVEGEIEAIAFGGEGILRYKGFVIFVPFTAVGDRISCRITEVKRSFAKGIVTALLRVSSQRTEPLCPYFGKCGGCQLQHLKPEAQLNYKLHAVQDALKRIGHLEVPPLSMAAAPKAWSYRRHITLHMKPHGSGFEAGYIGVDNHSFIPVKTCPIFTNILHPLLPEVQKLIGQIPNPSKHEGRLILLKNQKEQLILYFQFSSKFLLPLKFFQDILQHSPLFAGIIAETSGQRVTFGEVQCEELIEGLTFHFSPLTFIQNFPEQSICIVKKICELSGSSPQYVIDLYCGFGITSLFLAKQGHTVTGVEVNEEAIRFAKENSALNSLKNTHFLQGDVERILPSLIKQKQPSCIVINPPRQGLTKGVIRGLLESNAESLIYISCMPATLARDLDLLKEKYSVKQGWVYDMFPQTAHVETVVQIRNRLR